VLNNRTKLVDLVTLISISQYACDMVHAKHQDLELSINFESHNTTLFSSALLTDVKWPLQEAP
jgi:hypothetical protein